jgi:hypothetical protein
MLMFKTLTTFFRFSLAPFVSSTALQHVLGPELAMSQIDPFTATATDLQAYLAAGKTTSSALIELYSSRIIEDDGYLRAVISTTPRNILDAQA